MHDKLIGQWQLTSWEITDGDGNIRMPLGEDGKGYIFYAANGYMSVHLINPQFLEFKDVPFRKQAELTTEKLEKFLSGYFSYTGKYTTDANSVYHHLEMCSIPSLIDTTLKRDYQLHNDKLILTHKTEFDGALDDSKLIWNKVVN